MIDGAPTIHHVAIGLNLVASLASAFGGVVALVSPSRLSGSGRADAGEVFYARMYAVRTIPLGLAVGLIPFWRDGFAVAWLLVFAAVVQLADVGVAQSRRNWRMMTGASIGAAIHLACAYVLKVW